MSFESWKGQNFWSNFILVSIIVLELIFFILPDKQMAMWIMLGWVTMLLIIKSQIELKFYKGLTGITFLLGHTIWSKRLNEEMEMGIQKKIKYKNLESVNILEAPSIKDNKAKIDEMKFLFEQEIKANEAAKETPGLIKYELNDVHLYEALLFKELEYEYELSPEEMEVIKFKRIFLLLPNEWDKSFDFGEIDWILDYYQVNLNGAYVILQNIGWILGKYPMFKLRYTDKIGIEEMDEFAKRNDEIGKTRELALAKIIKEDQTKLIIFEEERQKLEIDNDQKDDMIESLKLKLRNAIHRPFTEKLTSKFFLPKGVAYALMIWTLVSFIIIGILAGRPTEVILGG